jgi:L-ribulose-5-phosphate 4-epimerase
MTHTQTSRKGALPAAAVPRGRVELAAATRLLTMEGILDYSGHISLRVPDRDAFLIQAGADSRAEVTPEGMLLVDYAGNVLEGEKKPPLELALHREILKSRPDVQAVLHAHMEDAIVFTMMDGVELEPMRARAARWASGIPTHPDPSHILHAEQGAALAATLGAHQAALIRAHGVVLVAESVPAILVDAVHFAENARAQLQVLQCGRDPRALTVDEIAQVNRHESREFHIRKLWTYYVGKGLKAGALPSEWQLADQS